MADRNRHTAFQFLYGNRNGNIDRLDPADDCLIDDVVQLDARRKEKEKNATASK